MTTSLGLRRLSLSLLAGTAAVALVHPAAAQDTEVSTDTTTPLVTSSDGNITVTSSGSVTVENGTAITVDSDNTVTLDGDVTVDDPSDDGTGAADGAGGVLITNGVTFDYTQSGDISVEDDTPADDVVDDADGLAPVDLADDRFGIRLDGGDYTGNISVLEGALVQVAGDNSVGVDLIGNLTTADPENDAFYVNGGIRIEGEGSTAVSLGGAITGDVTFDESSRIEVVGKNSDAIHQSGSIDGAFVFNGGISVTGFSDTVPEAEIDDESTSDVNEAEEAAARNDFQKSLTSGHGIVIGGDVTGGVLIDGPLPAEFGEVPDQSAGTSITVRGSGNALRIDGGASILSLGPVDTSAIDEARDTVEDNDIPVYGEFGLVNRGALTANGLYDDVPSEAVYIANADIVGGFRNDGNIDAQALNAASTGLNIGENATVPALRNRGRISAGSFGTGGNAVAIRIDSTATVTSLRNDSVIEALAISDLDDAIAIVDESGSLTEIINIGSITAFLADDTDNDPDTPDDNAEPIGEGIAIDLRANTSGVSITNTVTDRTDIDVSSLDRSVFGNVTGDVYTGSGDDSYVANAGSTNGDLFLGEGDDLVDLSRRASIFGDIDFGDGNDQLALNEALVVGDIDFGAGNSSFTLTNDSAFSGNIASAGLLDIDVSGSSLFFGSGTNLNVGTLTTSNIPATGDDEELTSVLGFSITDEGTGIAQINANSVFLGSGTGIRPVFEGAFVQGVDDPLELTIISAGTLTIEGGLDSIVTNQDGVTPIIFDQSLQTANGGNDLVLSLRRKSAAELGIGRGLANAYDPVIEALVADDDLGSALFNATTIEEFDSLFNQVIAGPLDAPMAYARAQNSSVTSLVSQRVESARSEDGSRPRRFWLQEEGYFVNRDPDESSNGFDGGGFVVAAGADMPLGPIDLVGVSLSFASARYDEQLGEDFPFDRTTYGIDLYYAQTLGSFEADGRIGYALTNNTSERSIDFGNGADFFEGEWDGRQITANSRVKYHHEIGQTRLSPFVSTDFISIKDDAYTETGNEVLIVSAEEREAESLRLNAGIEISRSFTPGRNRVYEFSTPGTLRPRLTAAWSQELLTDDYTATYNFGQPGENTLFTLFSEPESGAAILGGDIIYENDYATVHVGASGHFGEQTEILTLRAGIGLKW